MSGELAPRKPKILIVDDEVIIAEDLAYQLGMLGYEILDPLTTGEQAFEIAEKERPDLVLMDIVLAGKIDGIDAADRIRTQFGIPIVFISAYTDQDRLEKAKLTMPFGYILKPFKERDLKITIEMALYVSMADKERKKSEEELRKTKEQLNLIFNAVPALIWQKDKDGRYLQVNKTYCHTVGLSNEVILTKTDYDLFPPEIADHNVSYDRKVMNSGISEAGIEERYIKPSGELGWNRTDKLVYRDNDGNIAGTIGFALDITDRKIMERELKRAKDIAESATRAKSAFLANMSHEIRTPLNGLLGLLQLIQYTPLNEEQKIYTEMAINSGKILLTLINDILDLSKIESGKIEIVEEPIFISEILNSVTGMFMSQADLKMINLDCSINENVPEGLLGDGARIKQILINLIGNAIKFTPRGEVRIIVHSSETGTNREDVWLNFSVTDTGIGIPVEKVDHIFEIFSQLESSYTRQYDGAGLGLSIVKHLVELMGGNIKVESSVGKGTNFQFSLKLKRAESVQYFETMSEKHPEAAETTIPLNILLVEDNPVNQLFAQKLLERLGHSVTIANNGENALSCLGLDKFDLIFMDIQMPVMDGLEATRRIRRDKAGSFNPQIPIIAMTAYAMIGERESFFEVGMDDYVAKPIDKKEVSSAISRVLKKM